MKLNKPTINWIFGVRVLQRMKTRVTALLGQLEILKSVIQSVTIFMVNMLVMLQSTAKMLFHDITMFVNVLSSSYREHPIATFFESSTPIPFVYPSRMRSLNSTTTRTILPLALIKTAPPTSEGLSTYETSHQIIKSRIITGYFGQDNPSIHLSRSIS